MKKIILFFWFFTSISILYAQNIEFEGEINENTNWNYDTVKITGDVTILDGNTLNIEKDCVIEFQEYYNFKVRGCLLAEGLEEEKIKFTIADTTGFSDTSSYAGAWNAIEFDNISETNDSSKLINCIIEYGKARGKTVDEKNGGAIIVNNSSKIKISYCEIKNNIAINAGAGIYLNNNSSPIIEYSFIHKNRSFYYGGGISTDEYCFPIIKNNIIIYNIAYYEKYIGGWHIFGGVGGGIHISTVYGTGPTVVNNFICNNTSLNGAVYDSSPKSLIISNIICNNNDFGILSGHQLSHSKYINNTVYNNYSFFETCGIYTWANSVIIENNILWNNTNGYSDEIQGTYRDALVNYNNIETYFPNETNISEEPMFIEPTSGQGIEYDALQANWGLYDDSPCINAGNPDTTDLFLPARDFYENIRLYGNKIEIGAIENQNIVKINKIATTDDISIYPIPCQDFINIETNKAVNNIKIYDIKGRILFSQNFNNSLQQKYQINTSNLEQGIYYLIIKTKNEIFTKKISK